MATGSQQAGARPRRKPDRIEDWFVGMLVYVRRKEAFERVDEVGDRSAHSSPL